MSTNGTSCNSAARGRLFRPFLRASAPCPDSPPAVQLRKIKAPAPQMRFILGVMPAPANLKHIVSN